MTDELRLTLIRDAQKIALCGKDLQEMLVAGNFEGAHRTANRLNDLIEDMLFDV